MEWRELTDELQVFFVCTIVAPSPLGLKSTPELVFSSPGTYVSYYARYLVQSGRGHDRSQERKFGGAGSGGGSRTGEQLLPEEAKPEYSDKYDDFGEKSSLYLHSHPRKSRHEQNAHGCLFILERFQGGVFINNK